MSNPPRSTLSSLSVRLGERLEAHATGWGVIAIPVVVALVIAGLLIDRLFT